MLFDGAALIAEWSKVFPLTARFLSCFAGCRMQLGASEKVASDLK